MVIGNGSSLGMFDSSCGKELWGQEHIGIDQRPLSSFLTETFCGFMYTVYDRNDETMREGHFKLCLLDTLTGKEMYDEPVWNPVQHAMHWIAVCQSEPREQDM